MRMIRWLGVVVSLTLTPLHAQIPQPVSIPVPDHTQDTQVWCWAAVSQDLIEWLQGQAPDQCVLVAAANGANPDPCCQDNSVCMVTGGLQQIQFLVARFGGHASAIAPPANPMVLYQTLATGHPIVLALQFTPYAGHVVVLRGMEWVVTPYGLQPVLYINDPESYFTQAVGFPQLLQYWRAAIVVY